MMIGDVEHLYMYLLAMFMSSLKKCLSALLPTLLTNCFLFAIELFVLFTYFGY